MGLSEIVKIEQWIQTFKRKVGKYWQVNSAFKINPNECEVHKNVARGLEWNLEMKKKVKTTTTKSSRINNGRFFFTSEGLIIKLSVTSPIDVSLNLLCFTPYIMKRMYL